MVHIHHKEKFLTKTIFYEDHIFLEEFECQCLCLKT